MKILYVADGRSPTARNWISAFIERGHEVHLASTYPADPLPGVASQRVTPVAFSNLRWLKGAPRPDKAPPARPRPMTRAGVAILTRARHLLGPPTIPTAVPRLDAYIRRVQPEVVHALRIPYEGMLAAAALKGRQTPKLVVSVWGNDFTLHAPANPLLSRWTRSTLRRADALLADTQRDLNLARTWSLHAGKPTAVFPGGGGIRPEIFYPAEAEPTAPVIINPRGLRAYVRNDVFFAAAALVHAQRPDVRFVCPAMQGEPPAVHWVWQHGLEEAVTLLPMLSQPELAEQFRRAQVICSPSEHDGTPNSLLEALACGCFPVVGDIESMREWLMDDVNGLFAPPQDSAALATALLRALDDAELRARARQHNLQQVAERARYDAVIPAAEAWLMEVVAIG